MSKTTRRRNKRQRLARIKKLNLLQAKKIMDKVAGQPTGQKQTNRSLHLIYSPFTGVGLSGGFRGEHWFKERIDIFKETCFSSLKHQSNKDFIHWLSFRPEEANHPLIKKLSELMNRENYNFVFTFNGLMYHDDKFSKDFRSRFMNLGRSIRDVLRGKNADFQGIWHNKNDSLRDRLELSLSFLKNHLPPVDYIFLTRIDTDDMLHKDAVAEIQTVYPDEWALVYKNGYVWNRTTNQLCEWKPKTNPPFHTIIFKAEDFFNADKYLSYMRGFQSHEDIPKLYPCLTLPDGRYCVTVHSQANQISTIWDHPFKGKEIIEGKEEILKSFGYQGSSPLSPG